MKTYAAGIVISALTFSPLTSGASAASIETHQPGTLLGTVWVDAKGMSLYTSSNDTVGKSNCNDKCASAWPPLQVAPNSISSGPWTIVQRDDGSKQWAYEGKPLYRWMKDTKPGDISGDGVNGFHLAE